MMSEFELIWIITFVRWKRRANMKTKLSMALIIAVIFLAGFAAS